MITKAEFDETIDMLKVRPAHHNILVLVPTVSEETESGIIKGEASMQDEIDNLTKEAFLHVIAIADDVDTIKVGDRVYCQGTITTFSPEATPVELDVAPEGYTVGTVLDMYVKMII